LALLALRVHELAKDLQVPIEGFLHFALTSEHPGLVEGVQV
jgi:hypothetical protein